MRLLELREHRANGSYGGGLRVRRSKRVCEPQDGALHLAVGGTGAVAGVLRHSLTSVLYGDELLEKGVHVCGGGG
jgi:hypothetical protein